MYRASTVGAERSVAMRLKDLVGTVGEIPLMTAAEFSQFQAIGWRARLAAHPDDCLGCSYCGDDTLGWSGGVV